MKNLVIVLVILIATSLVSCSSEYDIRMNAFKKCVKAKKNEKKYKYANIQEALDHYDFEVARDFLACHPEESQSKISDAQAASLSKGMDGNLGIYQKDLLKIVQSEIVYFVGEGEFKKAEATAKEANLIYLYNKLSDEGFEKKLDEMIENKEYKKIYTFLSNKKSFFLKTDFDLSADPCCNKNNDYNKSAREFNAIIDMVLSKYKYSNIDKNEIILLIDLSILELLEKKVSRDNGKSFFIGAYLSDVYRKEATLKYLK